MLKKVLYVYRSRFRPLSGNKGNQRKRIQLFRILRNVTSFRPLSGNKGNQLCYLRFLRYRTRNGFRPLSGTKGNQLCVPFFELSALPPRVSVPSRGIRVINLPESKHLL